MTSFAVKDPNRADIAQLPVVHAHTLPRETPSVTSGSHVFCTIIIVRKKRGKPKKGRRKSTGKNAAMRRTFSRIFSKKVCTTTIIRKKRVKPKKKYGKNSGMRRTFSRIFSKTFCTLL
jgi:hypothetical protein